MKRLMRLTAVVICSLCALPLFADVPQLVNYQGRLTDAQGAPKVGTVNLSFEIYDGLTSDNTANKTWGPQVFANVPLVNGHFNVIWERQIKQAIQYRMLLQVAQPIFRLLKIGCAAETADN